MTIKRLLAIIAILLCTAVGWGILGTSLAVRTASSSGTLARNVTDGWGPSMTQPHPVVFYHVPGAPNGRQQIQPADSKVRAVLKYQPKKKGLLWHRTYVVDFEGDYTIENPTPIAQTIYVKFQLPEESASYNNFAFVLDGKPSTENRKTSDGITEAVTLEPGKTARLAVAYQTRGTERWGYAFGDTTRVRNFQLTMDTDFAEVDFPSGTGSPTGRRAAKGGWQFTWSYPDVINAQAIGMEMPKALNPGPVATRIAFFAPVSLVFFFSVLLIMATVWRVGLHPMNYFFLAAGCFAFQLLFAYLVDLVPIHLAFLLAAIVSLALVSGYLWLAVGKKFARLSAVSQFAYMVLFSYSFFFDGVTGLTITIGAVVTLALLMAATARVDWAQKFAPSRAAAATPPPIPQ